jgi:hypothetical protein
MDGRRLEGIPALEEKLDPTLKTADQQGVDEPMRLNVFKYLHLCVEMTLVYCPYEIA